MAVVSMVASGGLGSDSPAELTALTLNLYFLSSLRFGTTHSQVGNNLSGSLTFFQSEVPSSCISTMYPLIGLPPSFSGRFHARVILDLVLSLTSGHDGAPGTSIK
ncbi:hypothetical protein XELAEV_18044759mg [Xenopus laevis]|uniref:Uncharacterized protein n=1 Tax=Xenopus laevis TaxID=8355 RepID=A0A974C013_XENLA|nr:hypothetical protein XELAEV_18044759mg [Xenopus laevis]